MDSMTDAEVNEAVARKLGSKTTCHCDPLDSDVGHTLHYTTDIRAAWEIVEFVPHKVYDQWFRLQRTSSGYQAGWYRAMGAYQESDAPVAEEEADTAPMAICLAFLKLP
jgi:hypothetical protein